MDGFLPPPHPYDNLDYVVLDDDQRDVVARDYERCELPCDMADIVDDVFTFVDEKIRSLGYSSGYIYLDFERINPNAKSQPYTWAIRTGGVGNYTTLHINQDLRQYSPAKQYHIRICANKEEEDIKYYTESFGSHSLRKNQKRIIKNMYETGSVDFGWVSKSGIFDAIDRALGFALHPSIKASLKQARQNDQRAFEAHEHSDNSEDLDLDGTVPGSQDLE